MGTPSCEGARARPTAHEKPAPLDLSHHYSAVTRRRVASPIKKVYRFFRDPDILNAAGGLPNVSFFPFDTLEAQTAKPERWTPSSNHAGESGVTCASSDPTAATHIAVPKTLDESDPLKKIDLATALQYGLAQGYPPLLSWVRQFTREHLHPDAPYRDGPEVILTCGATDGFSKALNLFVDQWTEGVNDIRERPGLLCETFAYNNALNQATPLGMQVVTVKSDASGMAVEGPGGLEDVLTNWDPSKGKRPHLMYTVTLGHNPTGIVLSVERKKEIYAVCSKYDMIIVEDEPYWYLQFPSADEEEAKSRGLAPPPPSEPYRRSRSSGYPFLDSLTPSFLDLDTDGRVVRLDTFSKTVAPGCRLGWVTAQPAIIERFERINETTTQQPSGFVQALISELVMGPQPQHQSQAQPSPSVFLSRLRPARSSQTSPAGWDTSGWVRWLAGLRGSYERRMVRMCRALDAGGVLLSTAPAANHLDPDPNPDSCNSEYAPALAVTKTPLYTYRWPRGGMFIWLRMNLESHPLWQHQHQHHPAVPGSSSSSSSRPPHHHPARTLNGPALANALMVFLTTRPFRVAVAPGWIFGATDEAQRREAWAYLRLCFAAEAEENVLRAAERFVAGCRAFWEVRDPRVIERLLDEYDGEEGEEVEVVDAEGEGLVRLGWGMGGC